MEMIERVPYECRQGDIAIAIDPDPGYGERPDLWPSVGVYPVYDPFLYASMSTDAVRNNAFRQALRTMVEGRRVVDIGTGQNLQWAVEAAALGAKRVVAIEAIRRSHDAAAARLSGRPEKAVIDLRFGSSYDIDLDAPAEVCVAELIGSIASAEGMLAAMADARARLLTPDALVVPASCETLVGAVSLRSMFPEGLAFSAESLPYLTDIFTLNGGPFDIRLAVANPDPASVSSTSGVVERLRFDGCEALEATARVELDIHREGPVDGLLCWIRLDAGAGAPVVDSLLEHTSWIPGYLPVFDTPAAARVGDVLTVEFERRTGADGIHPDYTVRAALRTANGSIAGTSFSPYGGQYLGLSAVHRELFAPE